MLLAHKARRSSACNCIKLQDAPPEVLAANLSSEGDAPSPPLKCPAEPPTADNILTDPLERLEAAERQREAGNVRFKEGNLAAARRAYQEAISLLPTAPVSAGVPASHGANAAGGPDDAHGLVTSSCVRGSV